MSLGKLVVNIANQLFEYSNHFIEIRCDTSLPSPAFSLIEQDIHAHIKPIIVINPNFIPEDDNIIAHILGHEWGHHVLSHINKKHTLLQNSLKETSQQRQQKENEADAYAARFVKKFNYNLDTIIAFFREHPIDLENRIKILTD